MRVICNSVEEFLTCLDNEEHLLQDAIRVSISETPLDGNQRLATKFQILFQASAVAYLEEEGQYLLEVGKDCGVDIRDAEPTNEGSYMAKELGKSVSSYAEKRGWKVLPGHIQI